MRLAAVLVVVCGVEALAAPGFAVIAFGSAKQDEAKAWLDKNARKVPHHDAFPKLVESARIGGMNPGFWIVLVAMPRDKKVADVIGRGLRDVQMIDGAYTRPVDDDGVEDARVLTIGAFDSVVYSGAEYQTIVLYQPLPRGNEPPGDLGVRCRTEPMTGVVLVYTLREKAPLNFEVWLQAAQTSCTEVKLTDLAPVAQLKKVRSTCEQGD